MFRQIRRKEKQLDIDTVKSILLQQRRGIISVLGDNDYPYGVPINYYYDQQENKIYFHGSSKGHKAESISHNDKVCFTVLGNEITKDEAWAPYMQSVIIFGRCKLIDNKDDVIRLVRKFASKYYPNKEMIENEIRKAGNGVCMYVIEIEQMTGKQIQEK